jgi:hypothetical protein
MEKLRPFLMALFLSVSVVFGGGFALGEDTGEGPNTSKSYLESLKRIGRIDRIDEDEIVVDDMLYKITPATRWKAPKGYFKKGRMVELLLDQNGAVSTIQIKK